MAAAVCTWVATSTALHMKQLLLSCDLWSNVLGQTGTNIFEPLSHGYSCVGARDEDGGQPASRRCKRRMIQGEKPPQSLINPYSRASNPTITDLWKSNLTLLVDLAPEPPFTLGFFKAHRGAWRSCQVPGSPWAVGGGPHPTEQTASPWCSLCWWAAHFARNLALCSLCGNAVRLLLSQ